MSASRGIVVVACIAGAVVVGGCGVVPLREQPGPPPAWTFVDPHGRPRAFGGGVCPLQGRHTHTWPPSPQAAFVDDDGAWRETRQLASFDGPHSLHGRRCAVPTRHQHALDDVSAGSAAATP